MNRTDTVDWSLTTFEGAELEQMRAFRALPLRQKLTIIEEMADRARFLIGQRRRRGLSYFEPGTGKFVPGARSRD